MRRGLPHPWLPTPSGLCGLRKWVPHTSGHALWGGVVRPAEPEHHPSLECALPDDPTPKPFPRLVERASPPSSPPQQGPCLPPCRPQLVQEADVGIRPGPAQTRKQGRALQLRAVHPGALTPPVPSSRKGWGEPGGRRPLQTRPVPAPAPPLWWTVLLPCAHTPPKTERPDPRAVGEGGAEAPEQVLVPLGGRTGWDLWRAISAGLGPALIPRLPLASTFACCQEVGEEEAGTRVSQ